MGGKGEFDTQISGGELLDSGMLELTLTIMRCDNQIFLGKKIRVLVKPEEIQYPEGWFDR